MNEPRAHTLADTPRVVCDSDDLPKRGSLGLREIRAAVQRWTDPVAREVAMDLLGRLQDAEEARDALREELGIVRAANIANQQTILALVAERRRIDGKTP